MDGEVGANRIDDIVQRWIAAKYLLSKSERTGKAYMENLARFRAALQRNGLDLLDTGEFLERVVIEFLVHVERPGLREVAAATYNQRHAILSSFYTFAQRQGVDIYNPLLRIERMKNQSRRKGTTLDEDGLKRRLFAIDLRTKKGRRDFALIEFAVFTGKRDHELRALNLDNLIRRSDGVLIQWSVLKGGDYQDRLYEYPHTVSLLAYLEERYGVDWEHEPPGTPVWCSLSDNSKGRITRSGIVYIFKQRLGTTAVHTTRRIFAKLIMNAGASPVYAQAMLGHKSLATTQRYFDQEDTTINRFGQFMTERLGINATRSKEEDNE